MVCYHYVGPTSNYCALSLLITIHQNISPRFSPPLPYLFKLDTWVSSCSPHPTPSRLERSVWPACESWGRQSSPIWSQSRWRRWLRGVAKSKAAHDAEAAVLVEVRNKHRDGGGGGRRRRMIRLKRIHNFWYSMIVFTPFA
jgi:hypothetical protein